MIFETILIAIYYMLPAYLANSLPVVAARFHLFEKLNYPVDCNKKLWGNPLFGKTKTIRGFIIGTIGALLIGFVQHILYINNLTITISLIEYTLTNSLIIGFLLGFGGLLGDLIKSFLKRRLNVKSSKPWIIMDQIDYCIGALLLSSPFYIPSIEIIIIILITSPLFSFMANVIAYNLGWKKVWW